MTTPAHLTPTVTDRGFQHLPPIFGAYGGDVRVFESSAAESPHIWLEAAIKGQNAALHLPVEQAQQLAEQIMFLVQNHYHNNIPWDVPDA